MLFEGVEEIEATDWKERIMEAKKLVAVEFWHPQCRQCQAVEPVYDELATQNMEIKYSSLNSMWQITPKTSNSPQNMA